MRLLRSNGDGWFDQAEFTGKNIPRYAILSHTWGEDWDEISFEDIRAGLGRDKAAYSKLKFCAERAAEDGLEYFWVDTCCIDKTSSTELSEAINSMFRWYRDSARCYAFLADVPLKRSAAAVPLEGSADAITGSALKSQGSSERWLGKVIHATVIVEKKETPAGFRESKWFTRGWTLQELLAPESVEFFAADGRRVGDKDTLSHAISQATGIPPEALHGGFASLSQFSVDERLSWAKGRETKREEDAAYSLLGLFDLAMPLIYGEGRDKAFRRLHRERELAATFERSATEQRASRHGGLAPLKRTVSQAFGTNTLLNSSALKIREEVSDEQRAELMQMWWDETMEDHMDSRNQYQEVAVMLIRWTSSLDDLGVSSHRELEDLATVFQKSFNFQTQIVVLDVSSKSQHQLDRHIAAFIEAHDGPCSLLIVVYQGHSIFNDLYGRLELCASSDPARSLGIAQSAVVNWRKTENMLCSDGVDGDVLMLLDAAYPDESFDSLRSSIQIKSTKRLCELISACPSDQAVRPPGSGSLTGALVETLSDLAHNYGSRSYSTTQINQRLRMAPNRKGTPSQLWSLFNGERHIALSPLKSKKSDQKDVSWPLAPSRSYLKLGLAFRDDRLNREQIRYLTSRLAQALGNKRFLGLRKIDWLGVDFRPAVQHERAVLARTAIARWRQAVEKNRSSRTKRTAGLLNLPSPTRASSSFAEQRTI